MKYIDIDKLSKDLNMKVIDRFWIDYALGRGYGSSLGNEHAMNLKSSITSHAGNINLGNVINSILKDDWDKYVNFWTGYLVFCIKQKPELIKYVDNKEIDRASPLSKCCKNLKFPEWCRPKLEKIFKKEIKFEDFIRKVHKFDRSHFDLNSALGVYRLQGDEACLGILGQMFWTGSMKKEYNIVLIPGIKIKYIPEISDYVSGVSFPCWVMPFTKNLHWEERMDGWFLMSGNNVVDVAQINNFNVFDKNLGNRISFFGRGGLNRGVICYCWGDIVKAVGQYKGDVLVRSLSEDLFNNSWHRFGLGGLIGINYRNERIYGKDPKKRKYVKNYSKHYHYKQGFIPLIINLQGDLIREGKKEEVVYSVSELEDWFELAELCK